MIGNVEQRIVKARNELKAQKVAMELAYSSILWPENAATTSWNGPLNLTLTDGVVARFRVRFTRNDNIDGAPLVNFAQQVQFTPTFIDYLSGVGITFTANDDGYVDDQNYTGYVAESGNNYIDYYIDFDSALIINYGTLPSITVDIFVQAISMVSGELTITRLI